MLGIGRWNNCDGVCRASDHITNKQCCQTPERRGCDSFLPPTRRLAATIETKIHPHDFWKAFQGSWSELLHQVLHLRFQHYFLGKSRLPGPAVRQINAPARPVRLSPAAKPRRWLSAGSCSGWCFCCHWFNWETDVFIPHKRGDRRALAAAVTHQLPFVSASAVLMQRCRTPRVYPRVPAPYCHCQG